MESDLQAEKEKGWWVEFPLERSWDRLSKSGRGLCKKYSEAQEVVKQEH